MNRACRQCSCGGLSIALIGRKTMDDQQFNRLHQLLTKISNQLDDLIAIEKKSEDALDTIKWK
ncbi:hypothetical protein GSI01S_06_00150 [Gordonia sihwensis NBRC 108236]|uniref:Uncharacterized protein n=1 Tax=Gordonia sihwensis NBRC 108236 TaxID=1223544 RepID=L7LFF6_9ACTN|nr:hypothetical protein GSI01S_06_00150 [Gordonia sihwensis NBRC 108236]